MIAELIHNVAGRYRGVSLFCGIGERCREAEETYRNARESGVLERAVLVFGQMNEAPGARFRVGHAALTIAEHFRDNEKQDVLLLIDNIFRFIQAGTEVSGLMGRIPSRVGYQPTLATELAELEERISSSLSAAKTSVQAVMCRPMISPIRLPATLSPTSRHRWCCRASGPRRGFTPAIDPLASNSKMLNPSVVGEQHYHVAQAVRRTWPSMRN